MVLKQNVGIDVSMDEFEANLSVLDKDFEKRCLGKKKFPNSPNGFVKLVEWVDKKKDCTVEEGFTIEFTGVYHESLAFYLKEKGKKVHMVIPSKSKKYCESLSVVSKTDKLDAQSLAWLGLERKLKEWEPISGIFLQMRNLTREREEILKERTIISNRVHAANKKAIKPTTSIKRAEARIEMLTAQLEEIEQELVNLIESDQEVSRKLNIILTIKGVGFTSATTVIAETNGFASILNQKQLTSYAGYDVKLKESGKYKGRSKISKQGNAHIRRIMHFPAQSAITYNKPLSCFYGRVNAKKHKPMIAGVGVQRKLLCMIYSIWKSEIPFDPNYEINRRHEEIRKVG
jgi:transposase